MVRKQGRQGQKRRRPNEPTPRRCGPAPRSGHEKRQSQSKIAAFFLSFLLIVSSLKQPMALAAAARHSASKRLTDLPRQVVVSEPVRHALRAGKPVVALESTIITHGLPYDVNLTVGRRCESVINKAGATPATIALLDGQVHVGLDDGQLQRLAATAEEGSAGSTKTARRDLPAVLASRRVGGTTVSATAYIASMAGIDFFATGGIGGVHRGAETSEYMRVRGPDLP